MAPNSDVMVERNEPLAENVEKAVLFAATMYTACFMTCCTLEMSGEDRTGGKRSEESKDGPKNCAMRRRLNVRTEDVRSWTRLSATGREENKG